MKILSIHIGNINSLKGKFTIDFASGPLLHAGIFAITGSTGAGKTTILDAITLALYGRVARNKEVKEVMSNGAVESHAEVEFQIFDKKYLASWHIHKARGKVEGKILGPKRELALWNEKTGAYQAIAEKIKEVDLAVEKVSGLDYHRFTRSVLLSQGDFAAFLRANERERSDLLERITGTEIYSQLSIAAFERFKEEKQILDNQQTQLLQLGLLAEEHIDEKELAKTQKETVKNEEKLELTREKLQVFDRWKEAKEKLEELEKEQAVVLNTIEAFKPKALQLKRSKALRPHSSMIEKVTSWAKQIKELENDNQQLDLQYKKCLTEEKELKILLEKAISDKTFFQKEKLDKEAVYHRVSRFEDQLQIVYEQYAAILEKEAELTNTQRQKKQKKEQLSLAFNQLEKELKQTQKWLQDNEQLSDLHTTLPAIEALRLQLGEVYKNRQKTSENYLSLQKVLESRQEKASLIEKSLQKEQQFLDTLEAKYQKNLPSDFLELEENNVTIRLNATIQLAQEQLEKLRQLATLEEDYKQSLKEQQAYENHLADLMSKQQKVNGELLNLLDQSASFKEELAYKRAVFNQQQLMVNYKKDRENLKQGEACPLCLSTHHPFRDHAVASFVDKAKIDLDKAEAFALRLQQAERTLLQQENELHQEVESLLGNGMKNIAGSLEQQRQKLRAYENRMAKLLHDPGHKPKEAYGILLKQKLLQLEEQLNKWKTVQSTLSQLYQQMTKPKENIQTLDRKLLTISGEMQADESKLLLLKDMLITLENRFDQLGEQLSEQTKKYGYQFSLETAKNAFQNFRTQAAAYQHKQDLAQKNEQQYAMDKLKMSHMEEELGQLELEQKNTAASSKKAELEKQKLEQEIYALMGKQSLEEARLQLKEKEQQLSVAVEENQSRHLIISQQRVALKQSLKEKTAQLHQLLDKHNSSHKKLFAALATLGYTTVKAAIKDSLLPDEEASLEQSMLENNNRLIEIDRAIKEVQKELKKWTPSDKEKNKEETLRQDYENRLTIYQESLYKYGQLEEKFQQQQKRKQQHSLLLEQIEEQRNSFNRWAQLNELIGQADGKKFRTYAQGLTLKKLVAIANQYLEKLNGRYYIHKKSEADLELEIIDTYQADNRRSIYTLSGGETFLISLALAMGLSELAGKKAQIHSLFIDEGFGTLDPQSLDLALSTLENLQSEGKTIGVISHLKELKERIGVQIQLHKQTNGFSSLSISG